VLGPGHHKVIEVRFSTTNASSRNEMRGDSRDEKEGAKKNLLPSEILRRPPRHRAARS
jgi:hypothetical protein